MGRIAAIDGLRGACLVLMTISHLEFGRGYLLTYLHFKHLGFADSAQAFMFLSGLLVGLIGAKEHARSGPGAVARRNGRRALQLYGWHLGLLLAALVASRLLPDAWPAWADWLGHLFDDGPAYATAAATMLYQPAYLDVLPQYILYLLAAPFLVHLVATGRAGVALACTAGLWLVAQAGLHVTPTLWLERSVVIGGTDVVLRSGFNPLGWQLTFCSGLILGALLQRGELTAAGLFPRGGAPLQLALGVLLVLAAVRLALSLGLLDEGSVARLGGVDRRPDLGLLQTLGFASLAYAVAWLLCRGTEADGRWARRVGSLLRRAATDPRLVAVGRHALPVFCYHAVLMYALRYADAALGGFPGPLFNLVGAAALASLFLVARALEAHRRLGPRPAARPS